MVRMSNRSAGSPIQDQNSESLYWFKRNEQELHHRDKITIINGYLTIARWHFVKTVSIIFIMVKTKTKVQIN